MTYDELKQCSRCLTIKSKNDFYKDKSTASGLNNQCKECKKTAQTLYKERKKDFTRAIELLSLPKKRRSERNKKRTKKQIENLDDKYLKRLLKIPLSLEVPAELIELKRIQISIIRKVKK